MCGELQPQPLLELGHLHQLALWLSSLHCSGVSCRMWLICLNHFCNYGCFVTDCTYCTCTILLFCHTIGPGPISELHYFEKTDTSVNITWMSPTEPNGVIVAYFVEHGVYQNEPTTSVRLFAGGGPMHTVIQGLGKCLPLMPLVHIYIQACVYQQVRVPAINEGHKLCRCFQRIREGIYSHRFWGVGSTT